MRFFNFLPVFSPIYKKIVKYNFKSLKRLKNKQFRILNHKKTQVVAEKVQRIHSKNSWCYFCKEAVNSHISQNILVAASLCT